MLVNREIQSTFDSLGLGLRAQDLLSTLDFYGIQLKMFVRATSCRGHRCILPPL
jgi:hypothetical protein